MIRYEMSDLWDAYECFVIIKQLKSVFLPYTLVSSA